jgi:ribosome-binding factor A
MANSSHHPFPRSARVNQILREVISEELVRLEDLDDRIGFVTVTDVVVTPDMRQAVVYLDNMDDALAEALNEHRVNIQASVNAQTHLKRTPKLTFAADPAIAAGEAVDHILRDQERDE